MSVPVSEAVVIPSAGPQGPFLRLSKEAELLLEDVFHFRLLLNIVTWSWPMWETSTKSMFIKSIYINE